VKGKHKPTEIYALLGRVATPTLSEKVGLIVDLKPQSSLRS
jgi:hypothetical protein